MPDHKTMHHKLDIARRFGQAVSYDKAAQLQQKTARLLLQEGLGGILPELLKKNPESRPLHILEIGCGTGLVSQMLAHIFPDAQLYLTDIAPQMLERTRTRLQDAANSPLRHEPVYCVMDGEAPRPTLPRCFDLMISNLCIQWFGDYTQGLARLIPYLAQDGFFLATTLLENSLGEWRNACQKAGISCGVPDYLPLSYLQQHWPVGGQGLWQAHDLVDPVSSALSFLRKLHRIGASQPRADHRAVPPGQLRRAMALFDQSCQSVTYHVGLGSFRKQS